MKTAVIGASSSLPPLMKKGSGMVWRSCEMATWFSARFDAKQRRKSFKQLLSCDSCPVLRSVAFRFRLVRSLLLNLDPYSENNPAEMFPIFYKQVAWELTHNLAVIFRQLVLCGSFPSCWRLVDVFSGSKRSSSLDVGVYRPTSITPVMFKVYEKIEARKLFFFGR